MASIGHPVVGDTLYGAPGQLVAQDAPPRAEGRSQSSRRSQSPRAEAERLRLGRNFLHAAELEITHPVTHRALELRAPLPEELEQFLVSLEGDNPAKRPSNSDGKPAIGRIVE
jgi:23S rRNA pseudouridine1911/1915/1917 synthase